MSVSDEQMRATLLLLGWKHYTPARYQELWYTYGHSTQSLYYAYNLATQKMDNRDQRLDR